MTRSSPLAVLAALVLSCALPGAGPTARIAEPGCAPAPDGTALALVLRRAEDARARGERATAIFDLDGTLLDPTPRTLAIFAQALGAIGTPEATAVRARVEAAAAQPLERWPYAPEDTLARLSVPPDLWPHLLDAWRARFFTSDWLSRDAPLAARPSS